MTIEIISASVLTTNGADRVVLVTGGDLPEAEWPYNGTLELRFDAAADSGVEYVKRHFPGLPVTSINARSKKPRFSARERR